MAEAVKFKLSPEAGGGVASLVGPPGVVDTPVKRLGPVTFEDRVKSYYHTFVTVAGTLLVFLQEATPATAQLPEMDRHYISLAILLLTALVNAARPAPPADEAWVARPKHARS
jgi:hypothetical protein